MDTPKHGIDTQSMEELLDLLSHANVRCCGVNSEFVAWVSVVLWVVALVSCVRVSPFASIIPQL